VDDQAEGFLAGRSLAGRFNDFAQAFTTGAPLYSQFARRAAREPTILQLMSAAPAMQRIPVLLFASVQYLVMAEPSDQLSEYFPHIKNPKIEKTNSSLTNFVPPNDDNMIRQIDDAGDAFVRFVHEHIVELEELLATRSTQTNEIGRCHWFVFPFGLIENEVGPIAHIDIGSSAGLNLLFPHLTFDIRPGRVVGDGKGLTISCEVRGDPPIPSDIPQVNWSVGIDANPVDIYRDDQVRWLQACIWPEHHERFERLTAAIDLARAHNIHVEQGDAVKDVARLIAQAQQFGHPVITTSWVMNYLSPTQRLEFMSELDLVGTTTDFSWVIAESPRETPELPVQSDAREDITVISLVTWRQGQRHSLRLATTHPHGSWVNWGN